MKKRKKGLLIAILVAVFLITDVVPVGAQELDEVSEETDSLKVSGDYKYKIVSADGVDYAYVYEYTGTDVIVNVPSVLEGYTVRGFLLSGAFMDNYIAQIINLPNTIKAVGAGTFSGAYALKEINIDKISTAGYHSVDGVLYNGKELAAYPAAKEGTQYIIPEGISAIQSSAFYGCSNLTTVIIPETVTNFSRGTFTRCKKEMNIILKKNNFSSYDVSALNKLCCEVAPGTKLIVKTEELRQVVLAGMTAQDVYKDSNDTMMVEVSSIPSTALTFANGSTEQHISVSYTDTGYTGSPENTFSLHSLYTQTPADTTENVAWSLISGDNCCEVYSGGILETNSGGEAVLQGKDESGHTIILNVTVYSPMESFELYASGGGEVLAGEDVTVRAAITPYSSYAYAKGVTWESSDTDIAVVKGNNANSCTVTGLSAGKVTITAKISDNGNILEKSVDIWVMGNIADCTVDPIPTQTYTGSQICPVPVVRYNGRILTEGVDYSVSYAQNNRSGTQAGEIYINGLNTTFLKETVPFIIRFDIVNGLSDSADNGTSSGNSDNADTSANDNINNNNQKPGTSSDTESSTQQITGVKDSYTKICGSKSFILKAKGPSAVTYTSSDRKVVTVEKTGGKVTIKGIGKAEIIIKSGKLTKKVSITVNPKKLSSVKASASGKKAIKVSWKRDKMATGYQVQYASNSKFTKGKKTESIKKNKTTCYTIRKLKSKKKYYVRVRAYKVVKGKKYYSSWSSEKQIKLK